MDLSLPLIVLGAGGFIWTAARFLAEMRHPDGNDMSASIRFDRLWMVAALVLSAGLAVRPDIHWAAVPIGLVAAYAVILPLKWRVLKPLGRFLGRSVEDPRVDPPKGGIARLSEAERRVARGRET